MVVLYQNKIGIIYNVKTAKEDAILKLQPLVNFRNFHETRNCVDLNCSHENLKVNVMLDNKVRLHMNLSTRSL